jgi:ribosome maturation factor RimP
LGRTELLAGVRTAILPVLANLGYSLVEVKLVVAHGRRTLRVFIDKEGGVTLDDCARASKAIGFQLDDQQFMRGRYYLEVSSPGAERKLKTKEDFRHFVGRKAQIRVRQEPAGAVMIKGRIEGFDGDSLRLKPEDADAIDIPYQVILGANLCL